MIFYVVDFILFHILLFMNKSDSYEPKISGGNGTGFFNNSSLAFVCNLSGMKELWKDISIWVCCISNLLFELTLLRSITAPFVDQFVLLRCILQELCPDTGINGKTCGPKHIAVLLQHMWMLHKMRHVSDSIDVLPFVIKNNTESAARQHFSRYCIVSSENNDLKVNI